MPDHIATIFHVTDMHLFVDASGALREDQEPAARLLAWTAEKVPVPRVRALLSGGMWHDDEALQALCEDLPQRASEERDEAPTGTPILVLQTGDVEALGSAAIPGVAGYEAFPSFAYVHGELRPAFYDWLWHDLYGNHDTWPGAYPPMRWRHRAINRARIATVPGLEGPWPDVVEVDSPNTGIPVVVARVNTVSRTLLTETFASGTVNDHPPGGASKDGVIETLTTALEPWRDRPAVRIVAVHHPPHPFETTVGQEITTGWLEGGDDLAQCLGELRVQLLIAGHRHRLDPPRDVGAAAPQPPLQAPTLQLVAESPTQDSVRPRGDQTVYGGMRPLSFCRYRLWADDGELQVERTVFGYTEIGGGEFSRETSATFEGFPLE